MYKSPVLKEAIKILYTTEPWRTAIYQPWFDNAQWFDHSFKTELPFTFVAFAACAVSTSTVLCAPLTFPIPSSATFLIRSPPAQKISSSSPRSPTYKSLMISST